MGYAVRGYITCDRDGCEEELLERPGTPAEIRLDAIVAGWDLGQDELDPVLCPRCVAEAVQRPDFQFEVPEQPLAPPPFPFPERLLPVPPALAAELGDPDELPRRNGSWTIRNLLARGRGAHAAR